MATAAKVRDGTPQLHLAWLLLAACGLAAVLAGAWVVGMRGAPSRAWLLDLAAWVVGAGIALALSRTPPRFGFAWLVLGVAGVAATFLDPGLSDVHRWVSLGPVRLNMAELLLAAMLVALAALDTRPLLRTLLALATTTLLALQPDASQAVAFAGGSIVLLLLGERSWPRRVLGVGGLVAAAGAACLQADPLQPVPEVEGIVGLAAALSPAAAVVIVASLAGVALTPVLIARRTAGPVKAAAYALSAYLALCALAPLFGAFPVPLAGMGVSPILGAWLGFGALVALVRREG